MKRNRGRGVGGLEETLINALMGGAVVEKKWTESVAVVFLAID
jgi:hypothetical protein